MFCKNKLLKYLFPEYKMYELDGKLYIDDKFLENYSIEMLKELGYDNIYSDNTDTKLAFKNNRKRKFTETKDYFDVKEWYSPSGIKLVLDEPFKFLIKTKEPELLRSDNNKNSGSLLSRKGDEYEEYILNYLKSKGKVTEICLNRPRLNDLNLIKKSFESIKRGDEIIYQPVLVDTTRKIWGLPDFLIRLDVFKKIFPNNDIFEKNLEKVPNNFGHPFYIVLDVKLAGCNLLKNNMLCNDFKTRLNKCQVYIYHSILEQMQGRFEKLSLGYILGSKTKDASKNIYEGSKYLGTIDFGEKEREKYDNMIREAIYKIDEIRNVKDVKCGLKNPELKPKRKRNNFFSHESDIYENARVKYGYYNDLKLKVDKNNIKHVFNDLGNYNLVYVDFETINTLLCFPYEKYKEKLNDNINQICQIGLYYKEYDDNYRYRSFFSKSFKDNDIKENLKNFVKFVKNLNEDKEIRLVCWGNFEQYVYNSAKTKFKLAELDFLDLCKLVRKSEIFPDYLSLSLKKILKKLYEKYPDDFPENYNDLDIQSGDQAFLELYNFYTTKDEDYDKKMMLKVNIEKYNKIDCVVMYRIVRWLEKMRSENRVTL